MVTIPKLPVIAAMAIASAAQASALSGPSTTIVAVSDSKCLDIPGGSTAAGAPVNQYDCNGGGNQSYVFTQNSSGYYTIQNVNSGLCLDITGGASATANGVKLEQWTCNGGTNQQFSLKSSSAGGYEIVALNSGLCLDIAGNSTANNVQLEQWGCWGGANQSFSLNSAAIASAPATIPEQHWLVYTQHQGCFHTTKSSAYPNKYDCVPPLAGANATAAQVQSDYDIIAKYVTHWEGDQNAATYAIPAGIKMGMYTDPMFLHGSDLGAPSAAIARDTNGAEIYLPQRNSGGSYLGDMTSTALYQYEQAHITAQMANGGVWL